MNQRHNLNQDNSTNNLEREASSTRTGLTTHLGSETQYQPKPSEQPIWNQRNQLSQNRSSDLFRIRDTNLNQDSFRQQLSNKGNSSNRTVPATYLESEAQSQPKPSEQPIWSQRGKLSQNNSSIIFRIKNTISTRIREQWLLSFLF